MWTCIYQNEIWYTLGKYSGLPDSEKFSCERDFQKERNEDTLNITSSYFKPRKGPFYQCYSFSFTEIKH